MNQTIWRAIEHAGLAMQDQRRFAGGIGKVAVPLSPATHHSARKIAFALNAVNSNSSTRARGALRLGACLALVAWQVIAGAPAAAQSPELRDIVDALRSRQQKLRSARLVWKATETYVKNFYNMHGERPGPSEDTTIEMIGRVWLDGPKQRILDEGPKWLPATGRFDPRDDVTVSDGAITKTYLPPQAKRFGFGTIHGRDNVALNNLDLYPVAWSFRGEDMYKTTPVDKWSVSNARDARGIDCTVLKNIADGYCVWFAAGPGLPLVRIEMRDGDKLLWQSDIEMRNDGQWGWLPVKWESAEFRAGELVQSISASVTEVAVNEPMEPSLFEFEFPPDTEVYDGVTKKSYVVLGAGGKAPYTYQDGTRIILASCSKPYVRWIMASVTAVLLVVLIALFFVRRGKRARRLLCLGACLALVAWQTLAGAPAAAQSPELRGIVNSLRTRQQKLRSVRLVWKVTETIAKNFYRAHGEQPGPSEDTTIEMIGRVWLDGRMQRVAHEGPVWCPPTRRFERRDDVFVSGGTVTKTYLPPEPKVHGHGIIDGPEKAALEDLEQDPIAWSFRGEDMYQKTPVDKWSVSHARNARGIDCAVLKNIADGYWVWFSAAPGLPLVRIEMRDGQKLLWQADIETRNDDQRGWLPVKWEEAEFRAGRLVQSISASVTEVAVNEPIDPNLFEIEFPPGTEVYNSVVNKSYVVMEGGGKAPYTYQDGTRIILARGNRPYMRWIITSITAVILAALIVLFFVRRGKRVIRAAK